MNNIPGCGWLAWHRPMCHLRIRVALLGLLLGSNSFAALPASAAQLSQPRYVHGSACLTSASSHESDVLRDEYTIRDRRRGATVTCPLAFDNLIEAGQKGEIRLSIYYVLRGGHSRVACTLSTWPPGSGRADTHVRSIEKTDLYERLGQLTLQARRGRSGNVVCELENSALEYFSYVVATS